MVIDALDARVHQRASELRSRRPHRRARQPEPYRCSTILLADPYYRRKPPKSAGREQYGMEFVARLKQTGLPLPDLIATATVLTAATIAMSAAPFAPAELIVSGGGAHNPQILSHLAAFLPGVAVATSADAKEAIAASIVDKPSNLPSPKKP
jgi:anhydro-N-acetylmuramic acid kinase